MQTRILEGYPASMTDQTQLWHSLASRLGIQIIAPATLVLRGERVLFTALLPQFGAARGMIAEPDGQFLSRHWIALAEQGYGYSAVEIGTDEDSAREMLRDWSWAADSPPPSWY